MAAVVFGGLDVGSALGLLVCGPLIKYFGWHSVFYAFAALGLLWAAAWPMIKPEAAVDEVEVQQVAERRKAMVRQRGEACFVVPSLFLARGGALDASCVPTQTWSDPHRAHLGRRRGERRRRCHTASS